MGSRRADELEVGEEFAPLEFHVSEEMNENFLHAVEDLHPRYMEATAGGAALVHPALLINFSNNTRSPSFYLPPGMAAIHTHEDVEHSGPGAGGEAVPRVVEGDGPVRATGAGVSGGRSADF